jgi:DNA-binding NtrC family response regulator
MNRLVFQASDKVFQIFENYHWQGNIQERKNLTQYLVVLVGGDFIDVAYLPEQMRFNIN